MAALIPSASATGSGTMTLAGPSTNSNQTITIPDATGTMMVSGNMPAFSVKKNATQALSSATNNVVQLQTENFDTASCFNNTSGTVGGIPAWSFLPNVAGYYIFTAFQRTNNANGEFNISIYKNNGGVQLGSIVQTSGVAYAGQSASGVLYMNGTTDYVTLYCYTQSSCTLETEAQFSGSLIRSA